MTKQEAETANWNLSHTWADGLDLRYASVDLSETMVYSLLSVLGRIYLQAQPQEEQASRDHA